MSNFPAMYGENTALMEAMGYSSVQSASSHQPGSQVFTLEFPLDWMVLHVFYKIHKMLIEIDN